MIATLPTDEPTPAPGSRAPTTHADRQGAAPGHPGRTPPGLQPVRHPAIAARAARLAAQLRLADRLLLPFNVSSRTCRGHVPALLRRRTTARRLPVSTIADGVGLNITVMSYQKNLDVGSSPTGTWCPTCGPSWATSKRSWASCSARWRSHDRGGHRSGEEVEDAYGARPCCSVPSSGAPGSSTGRCSPATGAAHGPHGDGHPVLVLPGFTAGDRTTRPLRPTSPSSATPPYGWGLGVNLGPTERVLEQLPERVGRSRGQSRRAGQPDRLEPGGDLRREMARHSPDSVRQVLTLGSPFNLVHHRATHATRLYRAMARFTARGSARACPTSSSAARSGAGHLDLQPHRRGGGLAVLPAGADGATRTSRSGAAMSVSG